MYKIVNLFICYLRISAPFGLGPPNTTTSELSTHVSMLTEKLKIILNLLAQYLFLRLLHGLK